MLNKLLILLIGIAFVGSIKGQDYNSIRFCEEMLCKKKFSHLSLRLIIDKDTVNISKVNHSTYKKPLIPDSIHNDSTLFIILDNDKYRYVIPVSKGVFEFGKFLDICFTGIRSKGYSEYRLDWGSNIGAMGYVKRIK